MTHSGISNMGRGWGWEEATRQSTLKKSGGSEATDKLGLRTTALHTYRSVQPLPTDPVYRSHLSELQVPKCHF